ncbi:MAG: tRNA pseudouridine(55) synthase TruB [Anaerolineae bacterium]
MMDCEGCEGHRHQARARYVAPSRQVPLSGFLNVDKPPGLTSHDVVDAIRRVVGQRKVGHAGTLDPMATGVLLICLGKATRLAEYLMAGRKRYRATAILGMTTDTYDADGQIVTSGGRTEFSSQELEQALSSFLGQVEQVPPAYSAIKRGGQPLYRLARQGKSVDLLPRPVEFYEIVLLDWTPPALVIEVECSPGTYIRSLAHDLGQKLGSGAHLGALVRLRSGHFRLEDATSLSRLEEAFEHGQGEDYLIPMDEALLDWPAMVVGAEDARRISQGQAVRDTVHDGVPKDDGSGHALWRAYSLDGEFLAIMDYDPETGVWQPRKVFASG